MQIYIINTACWVHNVTTVGVLRRPARAAVRAAPGGPGAASLESAVQEPAAGTAFEGVATRPTPKSALTCFPPPLFEFQLYGNHGLTGTNTLESCEARAYLLVLRDSHSEITLTSAFITLLQLQLQLQLQLLISVR